MNLILGNQKLLQLLLDAAKTGNCAGCYMIEGANGTGKLTIARFVSAAFCCEHKNEKGEPCLTCKNCRQILSGQYIDVCELRPPEDKKIISVDMVREFLKKTQLSPSQGDWRIFIIEHSEMMNKEAQNALLKTIEEVPKNSVFFLLTEDQSRLLPTVRSRAVKGVVLPLDRQTLEKALREKGVPQDQWEIAWLLSRGSLGKALEIAHDEKLHTLRACVVSYFQALLDGKGFSVLCRIYSPSLSERSEVDALFRMTKLALRDILCRIYDADSVPEFFTDFVLLSDLAAVTSPQKAAQLFDLAEDMLLANASNVNLFSAISHFNFNAQELTKNLPCFS